MSYSHSSKYGLYFARASCPGCSRVLIKRRLYVAYRRHMHPCPKCKTPAEFRKAWWSYYVYQMQHGATYVEEYSRAQ